MISRPPIGPWLGTIRLACSVSSRSRLDSQWVIVAVGFMLLFSGTVSRFVDKHPTIKMLALSFLVLIGVSLVAESLDFHIPKGYIYFAMAFSLMVEVLNIKLRKSRQPPVHLHSTYHTHPEPVSSSALEEH